MFFYYENACFQSTSYEKQMSDEHTLKYKNTYKYNYYYYCVYFVQNESHRKFCYFICVMSPLTLNEKCSIFQDSNAIVFQLDIDSVCSFPGYLRRRFSNCRAWKSEVPENVNTSTLWLVNDSRRTYEERRRIHK